MIAGDFPEAHDSTEPGITRQPDGSFLVEGGSDIEDVARRIGHRFAEARGFHTAAGLVLDRLGRLPRPGTELVVEGWRITVLEMEGRRIRRLRLARAGHGASV